jgi:hypothetical protein
MNSVVRNFFYGVGFTLLLFMTRVPAATVQFGDLVTFIQNSIFWTMAGCIGVILVSLEFALSGGKIISARATGVNNARGAKGAAGPAK